MAKIQLTAPASGMENLSENNLIPLKEVLKEAGFELSYSKTLFKKPRSFLALPDKERLNWLESAYLDKEVKAILALRGGGGSARLLDKIDYSLIKKNKKPILGFSDITALQNALWVKDKLESFTGFLGCYGMGKMSVKFKKSLFACLKNQSQVIKIKKIVSGKTKGILLGGNLTVLLSLAGTPYFPKLKEAILLLEDIAEPPYKIDRMLNQLKQMGVFDKIKGLIFGDMSARLSIKDKKEIEKIVLSYCKELAYPVCFLKEYSHENPEIVLPIGRIVHLDTVRGILTLDKGKKIK